MLFMLSYIPPNDNPHSSDFYFLSFPMYANLYYPIHNFSMYIRVPVESRSYKNVSKEKGGGDTLSYTVCRDLTGKFLWQFQTPRQGLHPHLPMPTHISIIDFRNFFSTSSYTSFPSLPGHPGHSFLSPLL